MRKIEFSNQQIETIKHLYLNEYMSLAKIGQIYHVDKATIARVLRDNNVSIRTSNHKYQANYDVFENIDSLEKAYWLGFIAADGCVYIREKNASIILNLSRKDKQHLEQFQKFINTNTSIIDYTQTAGFSNQTEMSKIVLNSKKMAQDLVKLGITPRKSLTLKPPIIDKQYYLAYILGYFDGDGSIYKNSNGEFGITMVGTKETLSWITSILGLNNTKLEQRNNTTNNNYYFRCGGIQKPYAIMKQLYDLNIYSLERKKQVFDQLSTVVLERNLK